MNVILSYANALSADPEHSELHSMIEIARESGKRPVIEMPDIVNCILTRNTKAIIIVIPFSSNLI